MKVSTAMSADNNKFIRVMAVTSGKGGVGKTNIAINLSMAMADRGHAVTLMDADFGLANIDVLLNLRPLRNLEHVLKGEAELKDIVINGPNGIHIVPAASGVEMMSSLSSRQHMALVDGFGQLADITDVLVIDTSAGISNSVVQLCSAAQEVIVVVCNEPASIADAYATIKILNQDYRINRFRVLVNMVYDHHEGTGLYQRLLKVTGNYLDVSLHLMGIIPFDPGFSRASRSQRPLLTCFPNSPAALSFKKLAETADKWPKPGNSSGKMEFFVEQMLQNESGNLRSINS